METLRRHDLKQLTTALVIFQLCQLACLIVVAQSVLKYGRSSVHLSKHKTVHFRFYLI